VVYPKCCGLGECGLTLAGLDGGPQGIEGGVNGAVGREALSDGASFLATDFPKVRRIRCLRVAGIARLATSALLPCNTTRDLKLRERGEKCLESVAKQGLPIKFTTWSTLRIIYEAQ
jgi:hypothetical protein